ncbi:AI-2E family transporter [Paracoccus sp. Z330]|uniref:AI-2E family transporter n=1 Tax=Paracoccus onchidii TaxID=3017813 RepID=A0ABT4ZB87_9RHOB|nr:AI-2E family transporter [Paracoccus onchidii]MDB6176554.1 AI-2E family transporter [Paracoccus onchidii]
MAENSSTDQNETVVHFSLSKKYGVPFATILTVFGLGLLVAAIWTWSSVLLLGFAAVLVAIALRTTAAMLHRHLGVPLKMAILLTAIIVSALLIAILGAIGPAISKQFSQLLASLPSAWKQVNDWLDMSSVGQFIERRIETNSGNGGGNSGGTSIPSIFGYLTGTITTVFGGLANVVLMLTMAIFLALDAPVYSGGFLRLVPLSYRDRATEILHECGTALARWMGGQLLDMVIVALLTGLGLWLLGVPLAMVLGLIAGLTNIIPVVGPFMSGVPAVMFALTQGVDQAVSVALLFIAIQQIEGNILMPMIQQYAANLPPVLTILAIVAFGGLFGLFGVILATPLLLVSIILVQRLYVEDVLGDFQGGGDA